MENKHLFIFSCSLASAGVSCLLLIVNEIIHKRSYLAKWNCCQEGKNPLQNWCRAVSNRSYWHERLKFNLSEYRSETFITRSIFESLIVEMNNWMDRGAWYSTQKIGVKWKEDTCMSEAAWVGQRVVRGCIMIPWITAGMFYDLLEYLRTWFSFIDSERELIFTFPFYPNALLFLFFWI